MLKRCLKSNLFLFCIALVSILIAKNTAYADTQVTVQTGTYGEIVNVESGSRLNVHGNSSALEAAITIWQQDGSTGQQWQFCNGTNGYYLVPSCAAAAGRALNVYGDSSQLGSRICLWSVTQHDTQGWVVEGLEDGSFILRSKNNLNCCLAESGVGNGSAITLKAYSLTDKSIRWTSSLVSSVPEEPKEVKLSTTSIKTYKGIPVQLTLENADASKVTWRTSSKSKGTVSKKGIVTAKKKNCSFYIYADYEGTSYRTKVTVEKTDPKYKTFNEKTYFAKKNNVPMYLAPYSSAPLVKKLKQNAVVTVTGQLVNKSKNTWYRTSEGYYIYSKNCSKAPTFSEIEETVLFAQRNETVIYSEPDLNSSAINTVSLNTELSVMGEFIDGDNVKWYVTQSPDDEKTFHYIPASDLKDIRALSDVVGCSLHYSETQHLPLCTFCATTVMVRRKAVLDGLSPDSVTYEMIRAKRAYDGGLIYAQTYPVNGATYTTSYYSVANLTSPQCLIELCALHPEGIVVYDSDKSYNGVTHAICISNCVQNADGSYQFYAYDTNTAQGLYPVRLEETDLYIRNGSNMATFMNNLRIIVYIP